MTSNKSPPSDIFDCLKKNLLRKYQADFDKIISDYRAKKFLLNEITKTPPEKKFSLSIQNRPFLEKVYFEIFVI
jgi:hypothetical protein